MILDSKEIERMETRLDSMQRKLQQQYCETGKAVLEIADNEQKEINNIVDEMITLRRQLAEAKGELQCPECMAYNGMESRYCSRCGQLLNGERSTKNAGEK